MTDNKKIFEIKLDAEEQALLDSIEQEEWKAVINAKEEAVFARKIGIGRNLTIPPSNTTVHTVTTMLQTL